MGQIQSLNARFPIVEVSRKTRGRICIRPLTQNNMNQRSANPAQERQPHPTTGRCGAPDKRPPPHTEEPLLHFCIVNTP